MRVLKLSIENYKSLRSISIEPHDLTVLVGANASGKSNLADSIDFVSEVYRHGLEVAVARKGGYENIAHRKQRRTKGAISVEITVSIDVDRSSLISFYRKTSTLITVKAKHSFSFRAKSRAIKADFQVEQENLEIYSISDTKSTFIAGVKRTIEGVEYTSLNDQDLSHLFPELGPDDRRFIFGLRGFSALFDNKRLLSPSSLMFEGIGPMIGIFREVVGALSNVRVYQLSPAVSRGFSAPTPRPELNRDGANLPTIVDLIQKEQPENWEKIMQAMTRILPDLESISVEYTTSRTLGLFFHERQSGRPWSIAEVSDGTVQTLALLVAIFDPRSTMLVLEEPENSVHPWIIRNILDACREASKQKQILITTHSPVVINAVHPEQVWVIWRSEGESKISPLLSFDEDFKHMWEAGEVLAFDLIDSGAVLEAIPPAPSIKE